MQKYLQHTKKLSTYFFKQSNISLKSINNTIKELINKDHAGMYVIINKFNTSGNTHIVAKRGTGKHFFTSIPDNYLTLKGEEYFKSL